MSGSTFGNLNSPRFNAAGDDNPYGTRIGDVGHDARGNKFVYMLYDDSAAVSVVAGDCVGLTDADNGSTVTADFSRSGSLLGFGFAMSSVAPGEHAWFFVEGDPATIVDGGAITLHTSQSVFANELLFFAADNVANSSATPGEALLLGQALDDDSGSALSKARLFKGAVA